MKVYIGWEPSQPEGWTVARRSFERWSGFEPILLKLDDMCQQGYYWRKTEKRNGQLWDVISGAPMSTEFAITRFLVAELAQSGWAMFADCDVLFRASAQELFRLADPRYAVMCVKHSFAHNAIKKDGRAQLQYARKCWSSVMLVNCDHPANERLTVEMINTLPGRELHRFCWLNDDEIGELGVEWNWLAGHSESHVDAKIVHFTEGLPTAYGDSSLYAREWAGYLDNAFSDARCD